MAPRSLLVAAGLAAGLLATAAAAQPTGPTLKRIVLVTAPEAADPAGVPAEGPAVQSPSTLTLSPARMTEALSPLIGRPLNDETIDAARNAIAAAYAGIGRPFVGVVVPRQDVTAGGLQLAVVEARLGELQVKGATRSGPERYRRAVHLQPGGPIDATRLQADLDWINRSPYRRATVTATPGVAQGTTDINLQVDERRPFAVTAGLDNTGTETTGYSRGSLGFDWGDAFGRGDALGYQFSASLETEAVRQHSLSYSAGLPWRHTLALSASFSRSKSDNDPVITSTGETMLATARYSLPLSQGGPVAQTLSLGLDYKNTDNDILFGGQSVFPTRSEVDQVVVDYGASLSRAGMSGSLSAALTMSPGGLSAHNDDEAFGSQRAGASARYAYLRLSGSAMAALPRGVVLSSRLVAQVSDGPLLASEQLPLAGVYAVRAFAEQGAVRDLGLVLRNELRAPMWSRSPAWARGGQIGVSAFGFLDAATGANRGDPPGAKSSTTLASLGAGADVQLTQRATLRFSLGTPVVRSGNTGRALEAQFGLQASF